MPHPDSQTGEALDNMSTEKLKGRPMVGFLTVLATGNRSNSLLGVRKPVFTEVLINFAV